MKTPNRERQRKWKKKQLSNGLRAVTIMLPTLIKGEHIDQPEVSHASTHRVTIESSGPVPSHLDGEVGAPASRFEIEILPAALDLL